MTDSRIEQAEVEEKSLRNFRFHRLLYLAYGFLFISYSFVIWALVGYTDLPALILIWSLLVLAFAFVFYSVYEGPDRIWFRYLSFAAFIISLALYIITAAAYSPLYGTDEIAIDSYSAYLMLHGLNPYVSANMINVFSVTGLPHNLITPLLTGGAVSYLVYPALSALLFIPAVALGVPAYSILLLFNAVSFIIAYSYYQRLKFTFALPALVVAMLLEIQYMTFSVGGVTDIVWVTFVAVAYILRKKPVYSGIFFGMAVAFKQTPLVILPFFLYFLYRENESERTALAKFLLSGVLVFACINLPFIISSPVSWFANIAGIAFQPIIGVGIGPSIVSFAGFIHAPSLVFAIISISLLAVLFIVYVAGYKRLRYAFFTFPMIIFLFSFRVLENYLVYWPFFFFIVLPDLRERFSKKAPETSKTPFHLTGFTGKRKIVAALFAVLIVCASSVSVAYFVSDSSQPASPFAITGVSGAANPYMVPGEITQLTLTVNYTPLMGSQFNQTVLYRIFPDYGLSSVNSLLWSERSSITPGTNNVTIYPDTSSDFLNQNTSFRVEAYYGSYSSYYEVSHPLSVNSSIPICDPSLVYPTYISSEPYPGWLTSTSGDASFTYEYLPGGMNVSFHTQTSGGFFFMTSQFNFSSMLQDNYTYSYSFLGNGNNSNGSLVLSNGSGFTIARFDGVILSFAHNSEQFWLGYTTNPANDGFYEYNSSVMIDIISTSIITFGSILNDTRAYHWSYEEPMISFAVGSDLPHFDISASFLNTSLIDGNSSAVTSFIDLTAQNSLCTCSMEVK